MATSGTSQTTTQMVHYMDNLFNNTKKLFPNNGMKFQEQEEVITYKCRFRNDENGDYEMLPKTAEWFCQHKILPRIGDIVIPLDHGPVKKPFCIVSSVIWDTNKNEVNILLVKEINKKALVA